MVRVKGAYLGSRPPPCGDCWHTLTLVRVRLRVRLRVGVKGAYLDSTWRLLAYPDAESNPPRVAWSAEAVGRSPSHLVSDITPLPTMPRPRYLPPQRCATRPALQQTWLGAMQAAQQRGGGGGEWAALAHNLASLTLYLTLTLTLNLPLTLNP